MLYIIREEIDNMKKQTKGIIASLCTVAVCSSIIVGSTYALFTSSSQINIAVTSGTVDVVAAAKIVSGSSLDATRDENTDTEGTNIVFSTDDDKEFSGTYYKNDRTVKDEDGTVLSVAFTNGGSATVEDGVLTLNNITPGDSVVFDIDIENKSNVDVLYRLGIAIAEDATYDQQKLLSQLVYTINYVEADGSLTPITTKESVQGIESYYSAWGEWKETGSKTVRIEVSLPIKVGNVFKDIEDCSVNFTVEAVQGNAYISDTETKEQLDTLNIVVVYDGDDLQDAINNIPNGGTIILG
jgi:predicted ribosomally synthesized peptide with SipW-like signal peptide